MPNPRRKPRVASVAARNPANAEIALGNLYPDQAKFRNGILALARFEARVLLVDYVGPAASADDTAILVALLERAQRVTNFHGTPSKRGAEPSGDVFPCQPGAESHSTCRIEAHRSATNRRQYRVMRQGVWGGIAVAAALFALGIGVAAEAQSLTPAAPPGPPTTTPTAPAKPTTRCRRH